MDEYVQSIKRHRKGKEEFLKDHPRSPIEDRESFEGLNYYPVKPDYRLKASLKEFDEKEEVTVGTTTGGQRKYLKWGEFELEIKGEEFTLTSYKSEPEDERLWLPVKDKTSGDETYGTGRYLDLEEKENGEWVIDFNKAYNPYCAYNEDYECPIVPEENRIDVRIEAGEKKFS